MFFGLYAIAAYGPRWAAWGGLGVGLLGAVLATFRWTMGTDSPTQAIINILLLGATVVAAWVLGYLARTRRTLIKGLEERAIQVERDAAQRAEIAAAAERARIAREMHDVVAHSLSVMVVQADGALYAAKKRPDAAVQTLKTISETGRASLVEMRKLLGLLRDNQVGDAQLAPMPGAADISELVEQVRDSGLPIELNIMGDLGRLGSANGLTAFRIVQEALTNTLKHAGPGVAANVDIRIATDSVRIRIDDDGRGISGHNDGKGLGIRGIRERIALHAGDIEAGPRPGGGFRVETVLPLDGTALTP